MIDVAQAEHIYRTHFAQFEKELVNNGQSWSHRLRKAAISRFLELGFPTTREEEWKYTNLTPLAKIPFTPAGYALGGLTSESLARATFSELAGNQLVFVNGHYSPELSSRRPLPEGVRVGSLAASLSADRGWVEPHLARYASAQDHAFVALNTAFMQDGAFIYIPKGTIVGEPIHLLFVSAARGEATVSYPRNLIVVDQGSQATILESYIGLEDDVYLTNAVSEVVLVENAVLDHYKLQQESEEAFHIAILQVHQGRSSTFTSHSLALGSALSRNEVNTVLDGEGGECTLNGLYMVTGRQHVDNHTRIDHVKPYCTSRELYKGVLDGKGRGVFNGKIYVHKAAHKTDAKQTNKNLLLSQDALIDTKPQLEIHNNDVKCGHGSTICRLDDDAIFYLRSRGIDLETARSVLTYAFGGEIVNLIKVPTVRKRLDEFILSRLPNSAAVREAL